MQKYQWITWLLAGFLIMYHTIKIYTGLVESGDAAAVFSAGSYQNTVRLWIIMSLLFVIMFKRMGIVSMWLSIITLVLLQFIHLSGDVTLVQYAAPLKGFVLPAVITWLYWRDASRPKVSS